MKSNVVMFTILTIYFLVVATVYTIWSVAATGYVEWAGSIVILLSGGLTAFIATFLSMSQKKQGGVLVEDRLDADIDDGDPEIGEFSPWSWWPVLLAFSIGVVVIGLSLGGNFWLLYLGLPVVIIGVIGWIYEYYRGNFAR